MPQKEMELAMWKFAQCRTLQNYQGRFPYLDQQALESVCQSFGVSRAAAIIRLRELGYMDDHPYQEFHDPVKMRWTREGWR